MPQPGGPEEHGQFSIDTYRLKVLKKTQVSDPGSLGSLLLCVNTIYDVKEHDKCCFHLKCLLYVHPFLKKMYML